jgi:hypothetical protein
MLSLLRPLLWLWILALQANWVSNAVCAVQAAP